MPQRGKPLKYKPTVETSPFVQRSLDFPRDLWPQIEAGAKEMGMTKSQFVSSCCDGAALIIDREHQLLVTRLSNRQGNTIQEMVQELIAREIAVIQNANIHV